MNPYPPAPAWADDFTSVGVTGTNGKSSTVRFIAAGLSRRDAPPVACINTVDARLGERCEAPPADHAAVLEFLRRAHAAGSRLAAIEATSAALALGFARGWPFHLAVFTNLGHDHLKTHGSFEAYLAAKAQLFVHLRPGGIAVLNAGDPHSALLAEVLPPSTKTLWYAGADQAKARAVDLRVTGLTCDRRGLELQLAATPDLGPVPERLRLRNPASFQADNLLAALLACIALGRPAAAAAERIAACEAPRGRFEVIGDGGEERPLVLVDYAHNPEALTACLASARPLARGRVVLVFGAGGDADASKRAPLGAIAEAADRVILTSDNPRGEDPGSIIDEIRSGMRDGDRAESELARGAAIARAIAEAAAGDVVLIAGKGHERSQEIAGVLHPFCDQERARRALEAWTPG